MGRRRRCQTWRWLVAVIACGCMSPLAADAATLRPFGHACTLESYGVRFCPTASLSDRVPSWDGAPLDVDVTLPPTGNGPFPTIVMLHGYGQNKTTFETTAPSGDDSFAPFDHYTNVWFAKQGYAVVNDSVRGVGNSCGTEQSRVHTPACADVEFELGDERYDDRDVQYLLGVLVDEGIANPDGLGVTGISLGSIESTELALLKNRIRLLNGTFEPWRSPDGIPLQISAAYPAWATPDVVDILAPNGRFLDFEPQTATDDRTPTGVLKGSFPVGAAAAAPFEVYSSPTASFDLPLDIGLAEADPDDSQTASFLGALATYHQAIGMPLRSTPAPILIEDGWDDSVVNGASQAIRLADYLSRAAPRAKVFMQLADVGHGISNNKTADAIALNDQATSFFDRYLKHESVPAPPGVTAYTASCPASAPSLGPITAPSWQALDPGAVRFGSSAAQLVASGEDPTIGVGIDPVITGQLMGQGHCKTYSASNSPGTAVYTRVVTKTFTMLGLPTLRMRVDALGDHGQLDAVLWDVAPDGQESFVTRGTYSLTDDQQGTITWQLFGGGYTFPAGDTIRLELLAEDLPFLRPADVPVPVVVSDATIEIPAHAPPDGGEVVPAEF